MYKRRLLSLALALALCLGLLPPAARAADSDFVIDENHVLTDYTGPGGDVVIPDGVTTIRLFAFEFCDTLTSVTIPEGVTTIEACAFARCKALTSVTIPASVTTIDGVPFDDCPSLINIEVAEGNANYCSVDSVLFNKNKTTLIQCPGGKQGSYTIPDGVTAIGGAAFAECEALTSVVIPDSVTTIGDRAFNDCLALTSVTIPTSVTTIGEGSFSECDSLTNVVIPESVTAIGGFAFHGCDALTEVVIPESVTAIGNRTFAYCTDLTSVTIPSSVTTIGDGAFENCTELTSVTIPSSVTTIGDGAFEYCTALTSVIIPSSVTTIGDSAFSLCLSLASVVISEGVVTIGDSAFGSCNSLTSVVIPASVVTIGDSVFLADHILTDIEVAEGNANYCSVGGVLFTKNLTTLVQYPEGKDSHTYSIPIGVTAIGSDAFSGCEALTSVVIPDGVAAIGAGAFSWCDRLTSVVIPEGVTDIENGTFKYCHSLASVTIPSSVATIGDSAFDSCFTLANVTIPEGVTTIGAGAFCGCVELANVTIPASVTSIGADALSGCDSLTIYGEAGSAAQTYAEENGIPFVALGGDSPAPEEPTPLTTSMFTVDTSAVTYNGQPQTKTITSDLTEGTDYTVSYANNVNEGTATITITGKGNYSGKLTYTFMITQANDFFFFIVRKSVTLVKGATARSSAIVSHNAASITWKTSDPAVATVAADGTVTGTGIGKATITGTASYNGKTKTASYTVSVTSDVSVAFKEKALISKGGTSAALAYTYRPAGATVTVTSSDPSVASVGNPVNMSGWGGVAVSAVGGGTATITVSVTKNGVTATDSCTVTVPSSGKEIAQNFVAKAKSYAGKDRAYFGYTSDWCARFVGRCAKEVGAENIIPDVGSCIELYKKVIECGGSGVYFHTIAIKDKGVPQEFQIEGSSLSGQGAYTPQIGDLVIMLRYVKNKYGEWTPQNGFWTSHVEIVKKVDEKNKRIYLVGGNAGDYPGVVKDRETPISYAGNMFWTNRSGTLTYVISAFARPKWSEVASPIHGRMTVTFHCPINVRYTYNGEVLDSATGQFEASFGTMVVNEEEQSITVTLNDYYDADVEITGTGEGTMDLTTTFEDEDGATSTRSFQNVPISSDTLGKLHATDSLASAYLELYENEGENFVEVWTAGENETATERDEELTEWYTSDNDFGDDEPNPDSIPLTTSMFTVDTSAVTYNGRAQTKVITGRDGDKGLVAGTDYTVAYSNNVQPGTATITITGMGSYTGALTYTFTINAQSTGGGGGGSTGGGGGGGSTGGGGGSAPSTPAEPTTPAEPGKPASEVFRDVAAGSWYEDAVTFVTEQKLFQGVGNGNFDPTGTMTRGMVMTVLARHAGVDTAGGAVWYEKGMTWAKETGLSDGTAPESNVTREQLATLLYRHAGSPATKGDLSAFADGAQASAWALDGLRWAVEQGIITGKGGGVLDPKGSATRAEVAVILRRYLAK